MRMTVNEIREKLALESAQAAWENGASNIVELFRDGLPGYNNLTPEQCAQEYIDRSLVDDLFWSVDGSEEPLAITDDTGKVFLFIIKDKDGQFIIQNVWSE